MRDCTCSLAPQCTGPADSALARQAGIAPGEQEPLVVPTKVRRSYSPHATLGSQVQCLAQICMFVCSFALQSIAVCSSVCLVRAAVASAHTHPGRHRTSQRTSASECCRRDISLSFLIPLERRRACCPLTHARSPSGSGHATLFAETDPARNGRTRPVVSRCVVWSRGPEQPAAMMLFSAGLFH